VRAVAEFDFQSYASINDDWRGALI
jgi:hypothetical protein